MKPRLATIALGVAWSCVAPIPERSDRAVDDYRSLLAREYEALLRPRVRLDGTLTGDRDAQLAAMVEATTKAIACRFDDDGLLPSDFERGPLTPVPGIADAWEYDLRVELGASEGVPTPEEGRHLLMPVTTNVYLVERPCPRSGEAVRWPSPILAPGQIPFGFESLPYTLAELPPTSDAWPDYEALYADGLLDVDVYLGWDASGFHLQTARMLFATLQAQGLAPPRGVVRLADLRDDSGPFTKTIRAGGRSVRVEVRLYYPRENAVVDGLANPGDSPLERLFKESLATRDAVLYNGHNTLELDHVVCNGVPCANAEGVPRPMLAESLPTIPYPDKKQVILIDGCSNDYLARRIVEAPAKAGGRNLDFLASLGVIVVGYDYSVREVLRLLGDADRRGVHRPMRYGAWLEKMRDHPIEFGRSSAYGVRFLEDNPHLVPFADPARIGSPCADRSTCPAPMACIEGTCTAECTADDGCPEGLRCAPLAAGGPTYCTAAAP